MFARRTTTTVFLLVYVACIFLSDRKLQASGLSFNMKCHGTLEKICNYLGSYCHAEVITYRKKRSLLNGDNSRTMLYKRRMFVRKLVSSYNKCNVCHKFCWS